MGASVRNINRILRHGSARLVVDLRTAAGADPDEPGALIDTRITFGTPSNAASANADANVRSEPSCVPRAPAAPRRWCSLWCPRTQVTRWARENLGDAYAWLL